MKWIPGETNSFSLLSTLGSAVSFLQKSLNAHQTALLGISHPSYTEMLNKKPPNTFPEVYLIPAGIMKHPDPSDGQVIAHKCLMMQTKIQRCIANWFLLPFPPSLGKQVQEDPAAFLGICTHSWGCLCSRNLRGLSFWHSHISGGALQRTWAGSPGATSPSHSTLKRIWGKQEFWDNPGVMSWSQLGEIALSDYGIHEIGLKK